jgi:hypothetical protein
MKKLLFLLVFPILIIQACDEDPSTENNIKEFTISSFSYQNLDIKNISIDEKNRKVFVAISNTEIEDIFPLNITPTIKISTGAKISPKSGVPVLFNHPDDFISYEVTSEEGKKVTWVLHLVHKQIQNSDFQKWYTVQISTSAGYQELGQSANSTFWASANTGTSTYNVYNTQTYIVGEDTMALIKTSVAGPVVLAAGTLFTGKFNIKGAITNPTDPQKATDFGMPFFWKPSSMKFKFKYTAGADYIRATLINPSNLFGGFTIEHLAGSDNCKIYAFLEKRTGDIITEIARATFVSGTTGADFIEQTVDFVYVNNEEPTHLTVVFTSSKDGDYWTGAVGSTLIVNDLELLYP